VRTKGNVLGYCSAVTAFILMCSNQPCVTDVYVDNVLTYICTYDNYG